MNLKKLPKQKQQQLVLVALATLAALGLGYGMVIRPQLVNLQHLKNRKTAAVKQLQQVQEAVKHADHTELELADAKKALTAAEADVASGDLYAWVVTTLRRFKASYKVSIPQFSPLGPVTDSNLMPHFPYQQTTMLLGGTARFHDLGRFIADLENQFPHMRVVNLNLELNSSPNAGEEETLGFRMELVTLVKSNPT